MKTTMTPLFSLAAAALLPRGYNAFVVVPASGASMRPRAAATSATQLRVSAPSADEVQQRQDARAALLDSGGVDKLMSMLNKLRGTDEDVDAGGAASAPVAAAVAAPPAKKVTCRLIGLGLDFASEIRQLRRPRFRDDPCASCTAVTHVPISIVDTILGCRGRGGGTS